MATGDYFKLKTLSKNDMIDFHTFYQQLIYSVTSMFHYSPVWGSAVSTTLQDKKSVHSAPLPGSGVVLNFILDILKWYRITPDDDQPLVYHRMIEAFKWGYGYRSRLGDPSDLEYRDKINEV